MAELDSPERLSVFQGQVIATDEDPVLQELVSKAADLAGAPLAAVTLVMGAIQYFRAGHGLPPELAKSRATSREDSWCQFVVKDEAPFKVESASTDERVPQRVVETYGVQSYLGVPVTIDGQQAGSLCVFDVQPREFDEQLQERLEGLAARATERLNTLAQESRAERAEAKTEQALASARSLDFQARLLERAMSEIGPLVRIANALSQSEISPEDAARGASVLTEAGPVFELLIEETRGLRTTSAQLVELLQAKDANEAPN